MKIRDYRILRFYEEALGVDVSNIELIIKELDVEGEYVHDIPNTIFISDGCIGIGQDIAIVHEVAHVLQFEHNKSLCIDEDIKGLYIRQSIEGVSYYDDLIEIDAKLMSCFYIYKECGQAGLELVFPSTFKKGITNQIFQAIINVRNKDFREALFKVVKIKEVS